MANVEQPRCPIPRICAGVAADLRTLSPEELANIYTQRYLRFLQEIDRRSVPYTREAGEIMKCLKGNPECVNRMLFPDSVTSVVKSTD